MKWQSANLHKDASLGHVGLPNDPSSLKPRPREQSVHQFPVFDAGEQRCSGLRALDGGFPPRRVLIQTHDLIHCCDMFKAQPGGTFDISSQLDDNLCCVPINIAHQPELVALSLPSL